MVTPQSQNVNSYHKRGLVSIHQPVGKWLIFWVV